MTPRRKQEEDTEDSGTGSSGESPAEGWPSEVQELVAAEPGEATDTLGRPVDLTQAEGAKEPYDPESQSGTAHPESGAPITQADEDRAHKRNLVGAAGAGPDTAALIAGAAADHSGLTALEVERSGVPDKAVSLSNAVMAAAIAEPRTLPEPDVKAPKAEPLTEQRSEWRYPRVTETGVERMSQAEIKALAEQRGYDFEGVFGTRNARHRFLEQQGQDLTFSK